MNDFIVNTLMPILSVVVSAGVTAALAFVVNYIQKKTNIEVSDATRKQILSMSQEVVLKAEARAERYLVEKGEKWTGSMKHAEAVNKLLAMAPDLTHEQAKHYVDMGVAFTKGIGKSGVQ